MILEPRPDVPGAFRVYSGDQIYNVYVGSDPAYPPCDCPHHTYTGLPCKHYQAVQKFVGRSP